MANMSSNTLNIRGLFQVCNGMIINELLSSVNRRSSVLRILSLYLWD